MGAKLLWVGLTIMEASQVLSIVPAATIVGSVIMVIGCVLYVMDR